MMITAFYGNSLYIHCTANRRKNNSIRKKYSEIYNMQIPLYCVLVYNAEVAINHFIQPQDPHLFTIFYPAKYEKGEC